MITTILTTDYRRERIQMAQVAPPDWERAREIRLDLIRNGTITGRDEILLEYLRELNVLSLDQIRRLFWANGSRKTAYNRMLKLSGHHLLGLTRSPKAAMKGCGLYPDRVYGLARVGWLWLRHDVNNDFVSRYLKRDQVVHDLMVSELFARLTENVRTRGKGWRFEMFGEHNASYYEPSAELPTVAPDGLGILTQSVEGEEVSLPFFVEMDAGREGHGTLSSDWGRKVVGYDRFFSGNWRLHRSLTRLPGFPVVLVVTHGKQRMLNLAKAIAKKRQKPVVYFLARWEEDILPAEDIFTAPVWMAIGPDGELIGEKAEDRRPLMVQG